MKYEELQTLVQKWNLILKKIVCLVT